jgi:hypothetical protein
MAYTAWSVIFGEQPSAAKWNLLGSNDAAFNNGGGVLTAGLADFAVTGQKLATNAVLANKLATDSITLGYAEATTNQSGITTVVDITGASVAVTIPAGGRRIIIIGYLPSWGSDTANARGGFAIKEGATTLRESLQTMPTGAGTSYPGLVIWSGTPSTGAHTYKLTARRESGGGGITLGITGSDAYGFIQVKVE